MKPSREEDYDGPDEDWDDRDDGREVEWESRYGSVLDKLANGSRPVRALKLKKG